MAGLSARREASAAEGRTIDNITSYYLWSHLLVYIYIYAQLPSRLGMQLNLRLRTLYVPLLCLYVPYACN